MSYSSRPHILEIIYYSRPDNEDSDNKIITVCLFFTYRLVVFVIICALIKRECNIYVVYSNTDSHHGFIFYCKMNDLNQLARFIKINNMYIASINVMYLEYEVGLHILTMLRS
jgi:hypothetical protein